jgi:hypothetical protein
MCTLFVSNEYTWSRVMQLPLSDRATRLGFDAGALDRLLDRSPSVFAGALVLHSALLGAVLLALVWV